MTLWQWGKVITLLGDDTVAVSTRSRRAAPTALIARTPARLHHNVLAIALATSLQQTKSSIGFVPKFNASLLTCSK
jgi:hypothetical protein